MKKQEENMQIAVCNYLRLQYPNAIFMSDVASGLKMSIGQAVKAKRMRSERGQPDLFIALSKPNHIFGGTYHGLFLELKRENTKIFLKDGITLVADLHIREQADLHLKLNNNGYACQFVIGFDHAKKVIDWYMNIK